MAEPTPAPGVLTRFALRLRRITTSGRYLGELDGLRFIAIAWVVLHHIHTYTEVTFDTVDSPKGNWLGYFLDLGNLGVPLFFAISGFILALPFAEYHLKEGKHVPLKKYFFRRLTRLEPPYVIVMCLCLALHIAKGGMPIGELMGHFWASLFYVHGWVYHAGSTLDPVAWSLEIEVQFYICAPFLALVFKLPAFARRLLLTVAIVLFGMASAGKASAGFWLERGLVPNPHHYLFAYIHHFLVGFILADLYLTRPAFIDQVNKNLWDAIGIVAFFCVPFAWIADLGWFLFPLNMFAFYLGALNGRIIPRILQQPVIATLGGMCYTIYLLHVPIIAAVNKISQKFVISDTYLQNLLLQIAIMLPPIIIASLVFYALVERPCMDRLWPSKLAAWIKSKFRGSSSGGDGDKPAATN